MPTKLTAYQRRNNVLKLIGFSSYQEYLNSSIWRAIRYKVLKRANFRCEVCGGAANQVHHVNYSKATLQGKTYDFLRAVCKDCHEDAEMEDGQKTTLDQANIRMKKQSKKLGTTLRRVCEQCNNDTKHGHRFCSKCERKWGMIFRTLD